MGRSGLSSKRKHSKKKSLKASSEGRRKKRSSRNRSKKLRRHDDSFSSCSDDASTSSSLVSSSSSEGEYRSRRARSHTRNEVKGSRKRSRRRSLSEDSGKDSPPVKKRKGSKKKADSQTRKKNKKIKKKKSRRDAYISFASIDSASCSTCGDGNSSSDEGASLGRPRSRSREKKKDHRDSIKGRKGHGKNRSRSRSSSPSKLSNSCDDDIIEKVMVENNSRRLKSIITIVKLPENEEGNDMKKDELKEEIVYDYDDYPSCKSNDSNDGESKKELVDRSNVSPEKRRMLTSVIGEVNSSSSLKDTKSISPSKNASRECVGSKEKESNASGNIGSEVDNLESILRQKALENLSRFRGGLQRKAVVPVDNKHKSDQSGVKQPIIRTPSRLPAPEQDSFSTMAVSQPVSQRSRFTWRRDPSVTTGKEEKAATDGGTESSRSQAPAPKLQTANLSSTPSVENKMKIMENTSNDIGGIETNDGQKATTGLETKEGSSKEQQTESNNSQFEKKTMSVMRGGEMVQVSYKVYIPNRAPALARRQLKR